MKKLPIGWNDSQTVQVDFFSQSRKDLARQWAAARTGISQRRLENLLWMLNPFHLIGFLRKPGFIERLLCTDCRTKCLEIRQYPGFRHAHRDDRDDHVDQRCPLTPSIFNSFYARVELSSAYTVWRRRIGVQVADQKMVAIGLPGDAYHLVQKSICAAFRQHRL